MKKMKKLLSLVLSVAMVVAMGITVFADTPTTYTLTIASSNSGHTYEAYQVFTGDLAESTLSNVVWGSGVAGDALLAELKTDNNTKGDFSACTDAKAVAEKVATFGDNSEKLDAFAKIVGKHLTDTKGVSSYSDTNKNYTISNLNAGYYFVKDADNSLRGEGKDSYTKFILKLVKDETVTPKTDTPSAEKKVKENVKTGRWQDDSKYGQQYNDVADYNIGDDVPFAFYSKVPDMSNYTSYNYIFEDRMVDSLSFNDDVTFKIGDKELVKGTDYSVVKENLGDNCTFHVVINDLKALAKAKGISADAEIKVTFTAKLNEKAVIGNPGNVNEMKLKYSNNPNDNTSKGETPWDKVVVFTYKLDTTKVDGTDTTKVLKDAEFKLYRKNSSNTNEYVKVENDKVTGWTTNENEASVLKSGEDGKFVVKGLDDGTYYLKETKAPSEYNLLTSDIKLEIKAATTNGQNWNGTDNALTDIQIKVNDGAPTSGTNGTVSTTVENKKGSLLPSTGGIGTTIFYVIGGILMVGAGVILVSRRRRSK